MKPWTKSTKLINAYAQFLVGVLAALATLLAFVLPEHREWVLGLSGAVVACILTIAGKWSATVRIQNGLDTEESDLPIAKKRSGTSGMSTAAGMGLAIALAIAALAVVVFLSSCTPSGHLKEDAKPWLSPVVDELCAPACDVALDEALMAAGKLEEGAGKTAAEMASRMGYQWCLYGCQLAAHEVEPTPAH